MLVYTPLERGLVYKLFLNQAHCSCLHCGYVQTVSVSMDMSVPAALDTGDTAYQGMHRQLFAAPLTFLGFFFVYVLLYFFFWWVYYSRELVCRCLVCVFLYIHVLYVQNISFDCPQKVVQSVLGPRKLKQVLIVSKFKIYFKYEVFFSNPRLSPTSTVTKFDGYSFQVDVRLPRLNRQG